MKLNRLKIATLLSLPIIGMAISSCEFIHSMEQLTDGIPNNIGKLLNILNKTEQENYKKFEIEYTYEATSSKHNKHYELTNFACDKNNKLIYTCESSYEEDNVTNSKINYYKEEKYFRVIDKNLTLEVAQINNDQKYTYYKLPFKDSDKAMLKDIYDLYNRSNDASKDILKEVKRAIEVNLDSIEYNNFYTKQTFNTYDMNYDFSIKGALLDVDATSTTSYKVEVNKNVVTNYDKYYEDELKNIERDYYEFNKTTNVKFPTIDEKYEIVVS